jgi:phospholipid N-methyltransferase
MTNTAFLGTATYSPDDNKLRFYPLHRLSTEDYERAKKAGFKWAPKQELFVAPMWTPGREDLLLEWCGEIEDEDKSLVDRAEERAERFETYQEKRAGEAERTHSAVSQIADAIPFGQPILVGHHSERRARKDAERIENGMRKSIKLWETSQYWKNRAAGALLHAEYKELPKVRARRIKTIEADQRRALRDKSAAEKRLAFFSNPKSREITRADGSLLIREMLLSYEFGLSEESKKRLQSGEMSLDEAINRKVAGLTANLARVARWLTHYDNRLTYEKAMLDEQGASDLLKPKARPAQLPLLNYRAPEGIECDNPYQRGQKSHYPQVQMTKAEYAQINIDYKGTREVGKSHRVRVAMQRHALVSVFITDSKEHAKPEASATVKAEEPTPQLTVWDHREQRAATRPAVVADPRADLFAAAKEQLRQGVKVVAAPQLFPTPAELARKVVELAGIEAGHEVLEPSAGTGALLDAVKEQAADSKVVAVELNYALADNLASRYTDAENSAEGLCRNVLQADFLSLTPADLGKFDRIVMNPPFENGADIKHIKHAQRFLKSGGVLVAICANGPRQRSELMEMATHWEDLPAGSFKAQGTNVNAALVVLM